MAQVGLRYPVYAPLTEDEQAGTYTYGTGKVASKAMKVELNLNVSDSPLYADDGIAERVRAFVDGTMNFMPDDIDDVDKAEWLGNQLVDETVDDKTVKVLKSTAEDLPGYFGFGFIIPKVKRNIRKYRAILFTKVQFAEPNETAETKGQNISWQTPAIEGKIMRRIDGCWKEETTVETLELAKAWLAKKLNVGVST